MIRSLFLSLMLIFLVGCVAPGTTFEELDQTQIDEAIAIIKNTELDEPVERTRKESVVLVEDIIEKISPVTDKWCDENNIQKLDAVGKLIILMMICLMPSHQVEIP